MILEAFALLFPEPIHEKPVREMHHGDGSQHDNGQTCGREPGEKPSHQREAAEELTDGTTALGSTARWAPLPKRWESREECLHCRLEL
jgi:hypothetical protein